MLLNLLESPAIFCAGLSFDLDQGMVALNPDITHLYPSKKAQITTFDDSNIDLRFRLNLVNTSR